MSEMCILDPLPQFVRKRRPPRSKALIDAMERRDELESELLQAITDDDTERFDAPEHYADMYKSGYRYADGISVPFPDHIESLGRELCRADIRCEELGEREWLRSGWELST